MSNNHNYWTLWCTFLCEDGEEAEKVAISNVDPIKAIYDLKLLVRGHEELCFKTVQVSLLILCKFHTRGFQSSFIKLEPQSIIASVLHDGDSIVAFTMEQYKKYRSNGKIVKPQDAAPTTQPKTLPTTIPKPPSPPPVLKAPTAISEIPKESPSSATKRIMKVSPTSFGPGFDTSSITKIKFELFLKDVGGHIGSGDWVGLYSTRASSNFEHLTYNYVSGMTAGSIPQNDLVEGHLSTSFMTMLPGGEYEFRYFPSNTYECLGKSNPIVKLFFEGNIMCNFLIAIDYTRVYGFPDTQLSLKQLCIRDIAVKSSQDPSWHKKLKLDTLPSELIIDLLFACEVVCGGISDELFRKFMSSSLGSLYLKYSSGISDQTWKELHQLAPHITSITLEKPAGTESQIISMLQGIGSKLKTLNVLQHTDLTEKFISAVKQHCSNLECLSISESLAIPVSCMDDLGGFLPKLDTLTINNLLVTNSSVARMLMSMPHLTKLSLNRCSLLTDEVCQYLVKYCPLLRELSMGACMISNPSIEEILQLQHLESLELPGCFLIDDDVCSLFEGHPFVKRARKLVLGGSSLTPTGKENLRTLFAHLPSANLDLEDVNIQFIRSSFRVGEKIVGTLQLNDVAAAQPWIGLFKANANDNEYITTFSIKKRSVGEFAFDNSACIEGSYEVRYFKDANNYVSTARFPVVIHDALPSAVPGEKRGLQCFPKVVKPGGKVVCMLQNPDLLKDPMNSGAWVGMYRLGSSHNGYFVYQYFPVGQFQLFFQAPTSEGVYEFRFVSSDSTRALAFSDPFTVRDATSTSNSNS